MSKKSRSYTLPPACDRWARRLAELERRSLNQVLALAVHSVRRDDSALPYDLPDGKRVHSAGWRLDAPTIRAVNELADKRAWSRSEVIAQSLAHRARQANIFKGDAA